MRERVPAAVFVLVSVLAVTTIEALVQALGGPPIVGAIGAATVAAAVVLLGLDPATREAERRAAAQAGEIARLQELTQPESSGARMQRLIREDAQLNRMRRVGRIHASRDE